MANRYFEEKDHSLLYHKYMFPPPESIQKMIFSYLKEKIDEPFGLAVDVGCGTGKSTQLLAPHFEKVVGIDISETQISIAKQASMNSNVSFCVAPAEALPFQDASVDLVTSSVAAHWFDKKKFLQEVDRVLKPNGCLAVQCFNEDLELYYENGSSERLTGIFREVWYFLKNQEPGGFVLFKPRYKDIFNSISLPEKQIHTNVPGSLILPLQELMGFIESLCSYQFFLQKNPEAAQQYLQKTKERILEALEDLPKEAQFEMRKSHTCILACKSSNKWDPGSFRRFAKRSSI